MKKLFSVIVLVLVIFTMTGCEMHITLNGDKETGTNTTVNENNGISEELYNEASYAMFTSNMMSLRQEVDILFMNKYSDYVKDGMRVNKEVVYYEIATDKPLTDNFDEAQILNYDFLESDEKCFEIKNLSKFKEGMNDTEKIYWNKYMDELTSKYYITSKGNVFTLPGFKKINEDKSVEYIVNHSGDSYTK